MDSRRVVEITRWVLALGALAAIVLVFRSWLQVNPTTVALTLLLFILTAAARLGLRFAVVLSFAATACYNFYFLPPIGTFTVADPQNWLALFAFLATGVIGSRLSQRARDETEEALARQREITVLFTLSRELLQTENVAVLINVLPTLIMRVSRAESVVLYLLEGDRLYQSGRQTVTNIEIPHLRQLALSLSTPEAHAGEEMRVPLRAGVRPRGLLVLSGVELSNESFQAIGGLVSIALDRAQALEDVARSEASKESERLRTLILDSITHELRTPLTSIKGAATTLLTIDTIDEAGRHELLTIVDEESDRIDRLIGQAVEMAQIEAQEVHMTFAPITLTEVVEHARETCALAAGAHPVTVKLPPLPKVAADAEMIEKVLCNLLENAAKYSKPGSPIVISAEQKGGEVLTSVADRGIGIDPAEQGLIFDRLYRSRATGGTTSGSGMGLAISRAITEAHGGRLTVTSQLDHGSVFTFSLPVAE